VLMVMDIVLPCAPSQNSLETLENNILPHRYAFAGRERASRVLMKKNNPCFTGNMDMLPFPTPYTLTNLPWSCHNQPFCFRTDGFKQLTFCETLFSVCMNPVTGRKASLKSKSCTVRAITFICHGTISLGVQNRILKYLLSMCSFCQSSTMFITKV